MSAGSWQTFADALEDENRCLGELGAVALAMTSALVFGTPAEIAAADRSVETRRVLHAEARARRAAMMKAGFGDLTLRQVCGHAPGPLRRSVFTSLRGLRTRGVALQITVANNKALIGAGLERIAKTIALIQKNIAGQTGMYRRRGAVVSSSASLIVSRKA
jgi:hypothetical protein